MIYYVSRGTLNSTRWLTRHFLPMYCTGFCIFRFSVRFLCCFFASFSNWLPLFCALFVFFVGCCEFCHQYLYSWLPGTPFSAANFVKFHGTICEILWHYLPQIPYILWPVGVVVLTDNTSKYKEFIVTCNTKTYYIRPLIMKISS